jgi:hypothetical protein
MQRRKSRPPRRSARSKGYGRAVDSNTALQARGAYGDRQVGTCIPQCNRRSTSDSRREIVRRAHSEAMAGEKSRLRISRGRFSDSYSLKPDRRSIELPSTTSSPLPCWVDVGGLRPRGVVIVEARSPRLSGVVSIRPRARGAAFREFCASLSTSHVSSASHRVLLTKGRISGCESFWRVGLAARTSRDRHRSFPACVWSFP